MCLDFLQLLSIAKEARCMQYLLVFGIWRQNNFEELHH